MPKRELSKEQQKILEDGRTLVKILGLLEGLSNAALTQVRDACAKRITPRSDADEPQF